MTGSLNIIQGAGIDYTFMGAGKWTRRECECNQMIVAAGAGGFIDITSTAKNVVFCSTLHGQIKVNLTNGIKYSRKPVQKLVKKVQQISYNGKWRFPEDRICFMSRSGLCSS